MPVERVPISLSQFGDCVGYDPERILGVEFTRSTVILVLEPEEGEDDADDRDVSAPQR